MVENWSRYSYRMGPIRLPPGLARGVRVFVLPRVSRVSRPL